MELCSHTKASHPHALGRPNSEAPRPMGLPGEPAGGHKPEHRTEGEERSVVSIHGKPDAIKVA